MIVSNPIVSDPSPLDNENVLCILRDLVDCTAGLSGKRVLTLQAAVPARQAGRDIARACGYKEDSVSVHYEQQIGAGDILLEEQEDGILLGHVCSTGAKRYNFTIHELDGTTPQKLVCEEMEEKSKAQALNFKITFSFDNASDSSNVHSNSSSIMRPDTDYLGLVNQAMTCYLNSLLQTLYMTPEFRNALYRWSFDGLEEEKVKSIPYQLQRLFLQLQTSNKRSVETTDLTRSFGWDSSEVWQQHDVQELCRVMFDALEQQWKNTGQANLINQLYQGKLKDYVKCLECGHESARVDAYLDIPLVIRPFGSTQAYGSVREAMTAFVQPEILDGSNQYFCEKCNKKCNAHKGLKFVSFPYLLTLQLKRFDFDYATMHRIKLNDKVTFLEEMNLNPFITCGIKEGDELEEEDDDDKLAGSTAAQVDSSDEGIDEGIDVETGCSAGSSSSDSSSISSEAAANNSSSTYNADAKGPYVYELFSIMIHSGSAAGGHYYAYIKSFKDGQWYSFNDQQVSKITYDDIRKTYGGSALGRGFYSSAYTSSTSAYMLMYRQINRCLNANVMQPEEFPNHLKLELSLEKEREESEQRQREIDKSTCKIKLYCFHPKDQHKMEARLEIHKDKTLQEATQMAREVLSLQDQVSVDCCRLVKYDEYQDSLERSFEGEEDTPIATVLGGVKSSYTFDLLLETRRPEQSFLEYKPGGVTVKVFVVDIVQHVIQPPVSVRAYHLQTVEEFKLTLHKVLGISPEKMRCVLERFHNDLRPLTDPLRTLKAEGFYKSNKVFVECSGDEDDCATPYLKSRLYQLLDRHQHTISITCNLPSNESVEEYMQTVKEQQAKLKSCASSQSISTLKSPVKTETSTCSPHNELSSQAGEEALSEHDSAFFSGATNSKHSLSGLEQGSSLSLSSCTATSHAAARMMVTTTATAATASSLQPSSEEDPGNTSPQVEESGPPPCSASSPSWSGVPTVSQPLGQQLQVDLSALCSRLSSVGGADFVRSTLGSSHSDPSIYHTGQDSDDSMRCLGSSGGSPEDTSAEFNLSPEPVLSSPEEGGFTFEEDRELQAQAGDDDDDECWDAHTQTQPPQPLPSFLEGASADYDSDHAAQQGVEGCDINLSLKGRLRPPSPPPAPPPPPPPLPPPPPATVSSRKMSLDFPADRADSSLEDLEQADMNRYFSAVLQEDSQQDPRTLQVSVDKRITFGAFKQRLEPYVGVVSNLFKVYRVYSNNQELESVRLSDTLSFLEDGKFNIKLGRALLPGEHRVKVFHLCLNQEEPCKFLLETIFARGMTILEAKIMLLEELRDKLGMDVRFDRCRLRKKSWTNPCTIYLDSQLFETDIPIYPNWEIFLEVLQGEEQFVESSHLAVYVRHWHPSTHVLDNFQEIVLSGRTVQELKQKISTLSGIPKEQVEFAKAKGTFPCEVSVLEVQSSLEWNPHATDLKDWPLYISDDGNIIFFRDEREEFIELPEEKRKEIQQKENRTNQQMVRVPCSPRKERALKIYTDDEPSRHKPIA